MFIPFHILLVVAALVLGGGKIGYEITTSWARASGYAAGTKDGAEAETERRTELDRAAKTKADADERLREIARKDATDALRKKWSEEHFHLIAAQQKAFDDQLKKLRTTKQAAGKSNKCWPAELARTMK